ncbi:FadR/GntR family transcriptional regulator [Frateuria aurantia]
MIPANRATHVQKQTREALLQQVLGGKWSAGQRLPSERQLALELGVSRATVREAIQHLIAQGLLLSRPGSGVYLQPHSTMPGIPAPIPPLPRQLTDQPLWRADMLEFRLMFECGTARLAAIRADQGQRKALGQVIARMQTAVDAEDVDAEAAADAEFHELLAASAHNLMIRQFHTSVISILRLHITHNTYDASRRRSPLSQQQCLARMRQHIDIYEAVMGRLPDKAAEAMRAHILFVGAQFIDDQSAHEHAHLDVYRRSPHRH